MLKLDFETILINRIAQYKEKIQKGIAHYSGLNKERKELFYVTLEFALSQSKFKENHVLIGLGKAKYDYPFLKLKAEPNYTFGYLFSADTEDEKYEAFIMMLYVFRESDTYRRETECKHGCTHDWHNLE